MASAIERAGFNYSNPQPYVVANYGASERKAQLKETANGELLNTTADKECFICGRNILGASFTCQGHFVHAHCFQCSTCGADLSGLDTNRLLLAAGGVGKKSDASAAAANKVEQPLLVDERFYCRLHGEQRKQLLSATNGVRGDKPCVDDEKARLNTTTRKLPPTAYEQPSHPSPKGAYQSPTSTAPPYKKDPNNNCSNIGGGRSANVWGSEKRFVRSTSRPSTAVHHKPDAVPATVKNGNLSSELNRTLCLPGLKVPSISDRWPPNENRRAKAEAAWRYWKYKPDATSTCSEMNVANRYRIDENGLVTRDAKADGDEVTENTDEHGPTEPRHTWRRRVMPTPQRLLTPMRAHATVCEGDVLQRKLDREKESGDERNKGQSAPAVPRQQVRPFVSPTEHPLNNELGFKPAPPPPPSRKISTADGGKPACEFCRETISGPYVLACGRSWCPEHFTCSNSACARRLLGCGFIQGENRAMYCEKCYEALIAPSCAKCGLPIVSDCLSALKKQWHASCFTCAHCRRPFGNLSFYLEDGKPYCENDWNQLFTTKCVACTGPIKAGQRWVEALSSPYHTHCFNCTTCHSNLEGQSFYAREGHPYCRLHI